MTKGFDKGKSVSKPIVLASLVAANFFASPLGGEEHRGSQMLIASMFSYLLFSTRGVCQ